MSLVLDDDALDDYLGDYVDALDLPPCPRCGSGDFAKDKEFRAFVCDNCGLWLDDDADDYI